MTYRLPPLNGLRAFEAAARHLSIKHAAVELCVTAGVVSQQIKGLESSLGLALFTRTPRGIALTPAGETYLESVSEAFDCLSSATDKISASLRSRKYRVGISSALDPAILETMQSLSAEENSEFIAEVIETSELDLLFQGSLDAILRPRIKSHPDLHLDQLAFTGHGADLDVATLALMPGNKGCRGHRLLLEQLSRVLSP